MIRVLKYRPLIYESQGLPEPSDDFRYFALYREKEYRVFGYAALDVRFKPFCLLHLEIVTAWNHRIFKELENDWEFAKKVICSLGCNTVVLTKAGNLDNQASYKKLIDRFGFSDPVEFTQSTQEI
jgi:hypothetical protein